MRTDKSGAQSVITWEHSLVHHSKIFSASWSNTVGAAATVAMHVITPASESGYVHIDFICSADKSGVLVLREADTITGGTGLTPVCNNRADIKVPATTMKYDATVSVPGTVLRTINVGAGVVTRIGGEGRTSLEYILKASTTYTIIFTADGATTRAVINCDFYEDLQYI